MKTKLIIKYDPLDGTVVPDGKISDWGRHVVDCVKENFLELSVGSAVMIDEIRALINEGKLCYKNVTFKYGKIALKPDKYGRIGTWPEGFCDIPTNILERLLDNYLQSQTK